MIKTSLNNWLAWLESSHHKKIDLTLDRVRIVAERLNVLSFHCPVITVGGTNGKGSCVALLQAIYQQGGYRTACYTSPHLIRFNERICVNSEPASDKQLVDSFNQIEQACGSVSLTFFEYTTLAALILFRAANPDIILLEVGLGGRFDAVNIIDPDVSIIASIDLDHMAFLGNTRDEIAVEKAGIFRANRWAICGDENPPTSLIDCAQTIGAKFLCQKQDFSYEISKHSNSWSWSSRGVCLTQLPRPKLFLANVSTVLMAYHCLSETHPVCQDKLRLAIANTTLSGRFQQISQNPLVVVDVAHNPASVALLAKNLEENSGDNQWLAVFSALRDKDTASMIKTIKKLIAQWYIAPLATERGQTRDELENKLLSNGINDHKIKSFNTLAEAYQTALTDGINNNQKIIVFGSFYTVGAALKFQQSIKENCHHD